MGLPKQAETAEKMHNKGLLKRKILMLIQELVMLTSSLGVDTPRKI